MCQPSSDPPAAADRDPSATTQVTLADLMAAVAAFRDDRDWAQFHTPKNLAAATPASTRNSAGADPASVGNAAQDGESHAHRTERH
jgi:hypothetical protein